MISYGLAKMICRNSTTKVRVINLNSFIIYVMCVSFYITIYLLRDFKRPATNTKDSTLFLFLCKTQLIISI